MKFKCIKDNRHEFPVIRMCHVLGVTRRGYYAWLGRAEANEKLDEKIREIHQESRGTDGSPRIHIALNQSGEPCGLNRVVRPMQDQGISAKKRRIYVNTTDSNHDLPMAKNYLKRAFKAQLPNS